MTKHDIQMIKDLLEDLLLHIDDFADRQELKAYIQKLIETVEAY